MGTYSEVLIKTGKKAFNEVFKPRKGELGLKDWEIRTDNEYFYLYTPEIKWYWRFPEIQAFYECFEVLDAKAEAEEELGSEGYSYSFVRIEETGDEESMGNDCDMEIYAVRTFSVDPYSLKESEELKDV